MPVVLRVRGYRFEFYASDRDEPQHIHVKKDRKHAKYWLEPTVLLEFSHGYRPHELNRVQKIVEDHREELLEAWRGFFGQ